VYDFSKEQEKKELNITYILYVYIIQIKPISVGSEMNKEIAFLR